MIFKVIYLYFPQQQINAVILVNNFKNVSFQALWRALWACQPVATYFLQFLSFESAMNLTMRFVLNQIIVVTQSLFTFYFTSFKGKEKAQSSYDMCFYFNLTPVKEVEISQCCT